MKKIIAACILYIIFLFPCFAQGNGFNYDRIYESLSIVENDFINGEDPYEFQDYQKYYISPYPLIRTWNNLYFKNICIPEGYYLLNPRLKNGKDVILIKQNGKVLFIIPVFEKMKINTTLAYNQKPKPKIKWYKKPWIWSKKGVNKLFGKTKTPPQLPKSLVKTGYVGGPYFKMDVYYEEYLYRILFTTEKL